MRIAVIGSGYVGTTAATIFALSGHHVTALDVDGRKTAKINSGQAPFHEQGLGAGISQAVQGGLLSATTNYQTAVKDADFVFSCVGTPDNPDGSSNLQYVFEAAKAAAEHMKPGSVFVQKSTVPVGTGRKVIALLPDTIAYVSNPEFLRESTAIYDTLLPDRIVAGGDDPKAVTKILDLHKSVEQNSKKIAKITGLNIDKELSTHQGTYIATRLESAELIKVTANAFLALKISFANSIAKLADAASADVNEVMDAVGADKRIGRAFLSAGRGYGGGCFPKDVSGLIASAAEFGVDMSIMSAAAEVNESMPGYIAHRAQEILGTLQDKKVAVLGLAFKAGTSDARKSPGVTLANLLDKAGAQVSVYDPHANGEAKTDLRDGIVICDSALEAAKKADAVFVATAWRQFKDLDLQELKKHMSGTLIYDADNALDKQRVLEAGLTYLGVGKS